MPSIKRRSGHPWDGDTKNKTKNCEGCDLYVQVRNREVCGWGTNFKYLVGQENLRKCEYVHKEPPKNNSLDYILFAKQQNVFGSSKYIPSFQLNLFYQNIK